MNTPQWAAEFLASILRTSFQATVLAAIVLALQAIFRKQLSAAWRYGLWLPVVLRLLIPFGPESSWSLFNWVRWTQQPARETRVVIETDTALRSPLILPTPQKSAPKNAVFTPVSIPESPLSQDERSGIAPWQWTLLVWAVGVAMLAGRLAAGQLRLMRQMRKVRPLNHPEVLSLLEQCASSLGLRRRITIFETARVESPALFGCFRPSLLLPAGLPAQFTSQELRHVLLHELAHIRRGDVITNWAITGLQIVHWFNPFLWFTFERMKAHREAACDALVLRHAPGDEAQPYGATIIKLLERLQRPVGRLGLVAFSEGKSQLKDRMRMIARFRSLRTHPWLPIALLAFVSMIGLSEARIETPEIAPPFPEKAKPAQAAPELVETAKTTGKPNEAEVAQKDPLASLPVLKEQAAAVPATNALSLPQSAPLIDPVTGAPDGGTAVAQMPSQAEPEGSSVSQLPLPALSDLDLPKAMEDSQPLVTRIFKVNPNHFNEGLSSYAQVRGLVSNESTGSPNPIQSLASLLKELGLPFDRSDGNRRVLFYGDRTGVLFVRAGVQEMETIASLVDAINVAPPQVNLQARIFEVSGEENKALGFDWLLGSTPGASPMIPTNPATIIHSEAPVGTLTGIMTDPQLQTSTGALSRSASGQAPNFSTGKPIATISGILSDPQFRTVIRALEMKPSVKTLTTPSVTTLSGRQARISQLDQPTAEEIKLNIPATGLTLDLVPIVEADGYTIELAVQFSLVEKIKEKTAGRGKNPLDRIDKSELFSTVKVWNRQTVVIGGIQSGEGKTRKNVLVFITPTIVDPAGNPVHTGGEVPSK